MNEEQSEAKNRAAFMYGANKAESAGNAAMGKNKGGADAGNVGGEQQAKGENNSQQSSRQFSGGMDLAEK